MHLHHHAGLSDIDASLDGVENCKAALKDIESGKIHHCFVEMSACVGSCVGGPIMEKQHHTPLKDYLAIADYAGEQDFDVPQPQAENLHKHFDYIERQAQMPGEAEIRQILRQKMDNIVNNTPNGLIVLNDQLEVQQINNAAREIMNIRSASDVLGEPVVQIMDPSVFFQVQTTGRDVRAQHTYLPEYKKYVEQTVVYDKEYHLLICIMRDVTDEEAEKEKKEAISRQTVEIADKVVDKQMRIVQEIASLLGETAAETKIALTKLKESIADE